MDPTTAIIQFIGIVLFSAQVPEDPGLHAILPRIGHVHQSKSKNNQTVSPTGVESHLAVIMYRDGDRVDKGGWKSDGNLANGWKYVQLNGERVQFLSNGPNDDAEIPLTLPRTAASLSCNTSPQTLKPEYQPPYKAAAGVIDIPVGRLSTCETNSPTVMARVDTRLHMDTRGVLVVTATSTEEVKTMVLKGNAVVFVANVPPNALRGESTFTGEPHWKIYNSMLTEACDEKPALDEILLTAQVQYCDRNSLGQSYYRARKNPPMDFRMMDPACSNSQWP